MRYKISEGTNILSKFPTGATVTIALYLVSDESAVTLTSNSCNEISTTGVFKWNTSNITTQPTALTEYLWVATDGVSSQYGKLLLTVDDVWTASTLASYGADTMAELLSDVYTAAKSNLIDDKGTLIIPLNKGDR